LRLLRCLAKSVLGGALGVLRIMSPGGGRLMGRMRLVPSMRWAAGCELPF
jgi:hypothetical protein